MFIAGCNIYPDFIGKLPFRDAAVEAIYFHHVAEHLPDLVFHFGEMYRVLKPGGVIRVGGPHGDNAAAKFLEGDVSWFSDFPDKRVSVGGRFENFLLCRNEHLAILSESWLRELAEQTGFSHISFCRPVIETNYPTVFDSLVLSSEHESSPNFPHTLIMEASKI